jgi:tetratricopeptide (TPR) repeat protein
MGRPPVFDQTAEPGEQDWLQLVDDLIGQTEDAPDPAARTALLCKAAEIYERRLADPANAIVALQAAFRADPSSGRIVQELERLARANGKWAEVIASTTEVVEALETDPDAKQAVVDLWVQIAYWCLTGVGRLEDAAAAARHALTLDPNHGGALTLLEDIYRRQRSWDRFVEVLAQKWQNPYRDHYKIADAYVDALKSEPEHHGLLSGLAHLYEETGQWEPATETLRRFAAVAGAEQKVDIHHRLGAILESQLGDRRAAEEQFVQALALHPTEAHVPSMLALIAIYRARGDWLKALQLTLRAADAIAEPAEQVRLTLDAATICHQRLDDETQAAELYARTMALDPGLAGVAEPLSEIYCKRGDWAALTALAPRLESGVEEKPPGERAALFHRLGKAAEAQGDRDAAVTFYGRSFAADGAYLPTLKDWGALAFARQEWAEAARLYDAVLLQSQAAAPGGAGGAASFKRDEAQEVYFRLGLARLRLGDAAAAIGYLDRAAAIDARRRATVEALAEAYAKIGDVESVVRQKQALLTLTEDRDAKLALYEEIAELHWGGGGAGASTDAEVAGAKKTKRDAQRAIAAYFAALELKPDAHQVMHKVLDLLTETKQWKQAVQILMRLSDLDEGPVRARYLVAAGNILQYELGASEEAFNLYERALDCDPDDLKSFERIDKLLTATKDWNTLERAYRKQITRMGLAGAEPPPEKRPAQLALWEGLGEIYRSRLKNYPGAIAAFEVCVALEPDAVTRRVILAELYQLNGGDSLEKAIAEHRFLVKRARTVVEMVPHLKLLLRLFVELTQFDEAWCVSQVLVLLARADADERQLYEQYRPKGIVRARSRLTEELWQKNLYHPDEDRRASQILATVAQGVAMARAKEHKEWGLKRKERRDVATDPLLFSKILGYASQILAVPWPEVYLFPEVKGEIDLANARAGAVLAPAFIVGKDVLTGRTEAELAFLAGRALAMMRPDHFLRWPSVVPTIAELQIVLFAAIKMVNPALPVPDDLQGPVTQYGQFLARVIDSPQVIEQLGVLVDRFLGGFLGSFPGGSPDADVAAALPDLSRWARAVYLTATRAGFLISNDLEVATRLGQAGAGATIDPGDVVRDLVEFSVSAEYFTLRRHLGLGLG